MICLVVWITNCLILIIKTKSFVLTNGGITPLNWGGNGCWPTWTGSCGGAAKGPELLFLRGPSDPEVATGLEPPCIHEPSVWGLKLGPGPYWISVVLPAVVCVPVIVAPSPEDKLFAKKKEKETNCFSSWLIYFTLGIRVGIGGSDMAVDVTDL